MSRRRNRAAGGCLVLSALMPTFRYFPLNAVALVIGLALVLDPAWVRG